MANNRNVFTIVKNNTPPADNTHPSSPLSKLSASLNSISFSSDTSNTPTPNKVAALSSHIGINLFKASHSSVATDKTKDMPLALAQIVDYRVLNDLSEDEIDSKSITPRGSEHDEETIHRSKSDSDLLSDERLHRRLARFS